MSALLGKFRAWQTSSLRPLRLAASFALVAIVLNVSLLLVQVTRMLEGITAYRIHAITGHPIASLRPGLRTPAKRLHGSSRSATTVRRTIRTGVSTSAASSAAFEPEHQAAPASSARELETSSAASSTNGAVSEFPAFERTVFPVSRSPNWGAMRSPAEWDRHYGEMSDEDFVVVPGYNLAVLTTSLESLISPLKAEDIPLVTAKLFYSTRYLSSYDVDAGEFSGIHPGIDLKLAEDTPVGSIAGGRVHAVRNESAGLGLHVIVEHRLASGETYYAIYGHLGSAAVRAGQDVRPGQTLGIVGMTGRTTGPHLHLQIDRGEPGEESHKVYAPASTPSSAEAEAQMTNPVRFIELH